MPPDRNKRVEAPLWLADAYQMSGEQIRLIAVDLIDEVKEMSSLGHSRRRERIASRLLGYQVVSWMLQPLAAEYLLKSLSIRDTGGFQRTHDLLKLLEALQPDVRDEIAEQGKQQGIDIPEFLAKHRWDFVEWRYPFEDWEDKGAFPATVEFDSVLAVLVEVCEPGETEDRAQAEATDVKPAELTLLRHIMLACRQEYPGSVQLPALHDRIADRDEDTILYHVRLLEGMRFVEVSEQHVGATEDAAPMPHSVRLSGWVAASAERMASEQSATD